MPADTALLAAIASPRRREILRLVWTDELAGRRHPSRHAGRHVRRRVAAVARSVKRRPGRGAGRWPASPVPRTARGARPGGPDARRDVGRRAVAAEAAGRARASHGAARSSSTRQTCAKAPFESSTPHAPSTSPRSRRSSSRQLRRPSSASSPRATAGRRGGAPGRRSSRGGRSRLHPSRQWHRELGRGGRSRAAAPVSSSPTGSTAAPDPAGRLARDDQPRPRRRRDTRCICVTSSPRPSSATSTCRAGATSCRSSATSSTDLANARRGGRRSTPGSTRGRKHAEASPRARSRSIAVADVQFRDRFSLLDGIDDLVPHIGATQRFMPGLQPATPRRQSGTVRARCSSTGPRTNPAGEERGTGTNVFTLRADGMIESVVGFWDPPSMSALRIHRRERGARGGTWPRADGGPINLVHALRLCALCGAIAITAAMRRRRPEERPHLAEPVQAHDGRRLAGAGGALQSGAGRPRDSRATCLPARAPRG